MGGYSPVQIHLLGNHRVEEDTGAVPRSCAGSVAFGAYGLSSSNGRWPQPPVSSFCQIFWTQGAPWQGLEAQKCGWWVDHGVIPLAAALDQAMGLDSAHLVEMGKAGHLWMKNEFSWESVASAMLSVYAWLGGNEEQPSCVVLS
jgi:hypothetical protein